MDKEKPPPRPSTDHRKGDRTSSLPTTGGSPPGARPASTDSTGAAFHTPSPPSIVSPPQPSVASHNRSNPRQTTTVPVRPTAFRPVPTQAPGPAGGSSRAPAARVAASVVRHAAPSAHSAAPPATRSAPAYPAHQPATTARAAPPAHIAARPDARPSASARSAAATARAVRSASPAPHRLLAGSVAASVKGKENPIVITSPPPPRTSAQDSPAEFSPCSSREGSDLSTTSYTTPAHPGTRKVSTSVDHYYDSGSDMCTEDALALGLDSLPEARAQRRPRSSDGEAAEEAKRPCPDSPLPQRGRVGAGSPTFAEATRRTPTGQDPTTTRTSAEAAPVQGTDATTATESGKEKKRPRYPPLIVEKLPGWAAHFRALSIKLGHPPNARPFQGGFRFLPESEDEYRAVQSYLTDLEKSDGISWFAYSLRAERSLKVAIRGLPADTDPEDILEELSLLGFEPEYVRNINARGGRPGCIFHAVLRRQTDIRRISTPPHSCVCVVSVWKPGEASVGPHSATGAKSSGTARTSATARSPACDAARDMPRVIARAPERSRQPVLTARGITRHAATGAQY